MKIAFRLFLVFIAIILIPELAHAKTIADAAPGQGFSGPASANPLNFRPPATDVSIILLGNIFGIVDGVLFGTGSQIMGQMFAVFNAAVLSLMGIILMYTLMVSTVNTASEGQMLGQKWNSVWVPARTAIGIALLLPKASGYCTMQIFVMWVIVQGVGAADKIWDAALNYIERGGVIVQSAAAPLSASDEKVDVAADMLTNLVCMYGMQNRLIEQRRADLLIGAPEFTDPGPVPDFSTNIDFMAKYNIKSTSKPRVDFPTTEGGTYAFVNKRCGSVSWDRLTRDQVKHLTDDLNLSPAALEQTEVARTIAIQQIYLDMANAAQNIVRNEFDTPEENRLSLGKRSSDGELWISSNVNDPNQPPLMGGLEIKNAAASYYAIIRPTMNALESDAIKNTDFIQHARKEGWILAGSFYFNLVKTNLNAKKAVDDNGTVTVEAGPGVVSDGTEAKPLLEKKYEDQITALNAKVAAYIDEAKAIKQRGDLVNNYVISEELAFTPTKTIGKMDVDYGSCPAPWALDDCLKGAVQDAIFNGIARPIANIFIEIKNAMYKTIGKTIADSLWVIPQRFVKAINQAVVESGNPITVMARLGAEFIDAALALWLAMNTIFVVLGLIPSVGVGIILAFLMFIYPLILLMTGILFSAGAIMVFYVPFVPFIVFTYAALGWMIGVIESMVAAPIVAIGIAHPEGEHQTFGKSDPAIMLLLNVFLRPAMMIIALIAGIILAFTAIYLLNYSFIRVLGGYMESGVLSGLSAILGAFFVIAIYLTMYMAIVQKSFEMIQFMPDKILRWLSGGYQAALGSETAGMAGEARGTVSSGAQQISSTGGQMKGGDYQTAKRSIKRGRTDSPEEKSQKGGGGKAKPGDEGGVQIGSGGGGGSKGGSGGGAGGAGGAGAAGAGAAGAGGAAAGS